MRKGVVKIPHNKLCEMKRPELLKYLDTLDRPNVTSIEMTNTFKNEGNKKSKYTALEFWRILASLGWNDSFDELNTWFKPKGVKLRGIGLNFDFTRGCSDVTKWDSILAYNDFYYAVGVESFQQKIGDMFKNLVSVHEPMGCTGDFCYYGSHERPDLRWVVSDINRVGIDVAKSRKWPTEPTLVLGNITDYSFMRRHGGSGTMVYVGKESLNLLEPRAMETAVSNIAHYNQYAVLELMEYSADLTTGWRDSYRKRIFKGTQYKADAAMHSCNRYEMSGKFNCEITQGGDGVCSVLDYPDWTLYSVSEVLHAFQKTGRVKNIWDITEKPKLTSEIKPNSKLNNLAYLIAIEFGI